MKTKRTNFLLLFFTTAMFLVVVNGCKKDDDPSPDPVTDIDGNVYKTVKIGNQIWMAENLKVSKLNDRTNITWVTVGQSWAETEDPAYCGYAKSQENADIYGGLYNWAAVNTGKLAPEGWHVATKFDWAKLIEYLGGETETPIKLKESGTVHWTSPNDATNITGFTALPGGSRNTEGIFFGLGINATWWSATESSDSKAYLFELSTNNVNPLQSASYKECGFSIRCVKD
jgi:uncharacterized protein (TIGR02145 family)